MMASSARKGRPTTNDARQKLEQVLAVAREQFSQLGYRAVTMRGVAEKAHVSTRTLYNRYEDKLSLFVACLDSGSTEFPVPTIRAGEAIGQALQAFAAAVARMLSADSALRLGMLVYREGADFPELVRAAEQNQARYLVAPLAIFLRNVGLEEPGSEDRAKLFLAMALSEWQRRVAFRHPLPNGDELERHAAFAVDIFLNGARRS